MKSLHPTASEPPTNIICVWNAVRCASGSYIPMNVTFGPTNVWGITASMIDCENGMGNSLGGVKHSRFSASRLPGWLRNPRRNSSFACINLHSSPATPPDPPVCVLAQPLMPPSLPVGLASSPWPVAWSCHHSQRASNYALSSSFCVISWRTSNCNCDSWTILRWKLSGNANER